MNRRTAWWLALAALPLFVLGLRWASFMPSVIDWDESLYILQAREWRRGVWPLSGVWDMHPVGAPALIALAFALLGESVTTVRLLGAACVTATGYALVLLVRALGGSRAMGYGAALLYAGHTVVLGGLATNTEILFAPLVVGALVLAVWPTPTGLTPIGPTPALLWPRLVGMGLLIGCALVIKPVATPEGCLAFALLAWPVLRARRFGLLAGMAGAYFVLCLMPTLLVAGAYAGRGEFDAWLDSTILAPFQYAADGVAAEVVLHRITVYLLEMRWLLLLPVPALLLLPRLDPDLRRLTRFGLLWLAVAVPAVAAPGYFFSHYFLILMPPLAVLSAAGAFAAARFVAPGRAEVVAPGRAEVEAPGRAEVVAPGRAEVEAPGRAEVEAPGRARLMALTLIGVIAAGPLAFDLRARLVPGFHMGMPDTPTRVSSAIRAEMRPGDVVFVVNSQPVIYFLTVSPLPTRFPFPAHLTGAFGRLAGQDMDAEVARIMATRPRFVVVDREYWFMMRPAAERLVSAALAADYTLAHSFPGDPGLVEVFRLEEDG
jgi:hypothetical protein